MLGFSFIHIARLLLQKNLVLRWIPYITLITNEPAERRREADEAAALIEPKRERSRENVM